MARRKKRTIPPSLQTKMQNARCIRRSNSSKKLSGLSGIGSKINQANMLDAVMKTGLTLIGFVGTKTANKMVEEKILKGDVEGFKKFIAGGGSSLLGVIATIGGSKYIKPLGVGMTAAGLLDVAKAATGKDFSKGFLGEIDDDVYAIGSTNEFAKLPAPPYPTDDVEEKEEMDNYEENDDLLI